MGGAAGEKEALNEEKMQFLERELKDTSVRAETAERMCAVLKNTILETENEINNWVKNAKTSTNRCLSWTTSLMTLRTFASKQLVVVVAQTVADRPQRTLSVQKLNYSERKKKMGVADQNPEQIPDHRPRPRHQHQLQHQHQ